VQFQTASKNFYNLHDVEDKLAALQTETNRLESDLEEIKNSETYSHGR
jgi:hypothetical protein